MLKRHYFFVDSSNLITKQKKETLHKREFLFIGVARLQARRISATPLLACPSGFHFRESAKNNARFRFAQTPLFFVELVSSNLITN